MYFQTFLPQFFSKSSSFDLRGLNDYRTVLIRLKQVPDYLRNITELLQEGIKHKLTHARESLEKGLPGFDRLQVPPTESEFFGLFRQLHSKYPNDNYAIELQAVALELIGNQILPGFRKLKTFIQNEYLPHARPGIGISTVPGGSEYYQACLEYHTSIAGITPLEVHNIGLEEVATLRKGVLEVARELGLGNLTFSQFIKRVQVKILNNNKNYRLNNIFYLFRLTLHSGLIQRRTFFPISVVFSMIK